MNDDVAVPRAVDVEVAAAAAEIEVGRGVADPGPPAGALDPDSALDLGDPYRERPTVDAGAPADVADRDLTGRDVRLQRVDAIQPAMCRWDAWAAAIRGEVRG
ncbi:MAG: hypothetical protein J2P30_01015 [Actinobacteria bacterium]|nr:hypothetical protein [Actinomycetota bacterium]